MNVGRRLVAYRRARRGHEAEFLRSLLVLSTGSTGSVLTASAGTLAVATSLGPAGYGDYATVLAIFSVANSLVEGPLVTAYMAMVETSEKARLSIRPLILSRCACALPICSVALAIVQLLSFRSAAVEGLAALMAAQTLISAVGGSLQAVAQLGRRPAVWACADFLGNVVCYGLIIGLAVSGTGDLLVEAGLAAAIGAVVTGSCAMIMYRSEVSYGLAGAALNAWDLIRGSWAIGVTVLTGALYFRVEIILLAFISSPAEVGYFSIAYRGFELLLIPSGFIQGLLVSKQSAAANLPVDSSMERLLRASAVGGAIVGLLALVFIRPTLRLLGLKRYFPIIPIVQQLAVVVPCVWVGAGMGAILIGRSLIQRYIPVNLCLLALRVTLNVAFIPILQAQGAALSTGAAELMSIAIASRFLRLHVGLEVRGELMLLLLIMYGVGLSATIQVPDSIMTGAAWGLGCAAALGVATVRYGRRGPGGLQR